MAVFRKAAVRCFRDAEVAGGHHAGGGAAATDVGGAGAEVGGVIALGTAGAELHDRAAGGRTHDAVGFGGDQALVVEGDQQQGLQQLALNGRAFHGNDRLLREDRHAFLDGPDVAVQLEVGQVVQEFLIECAGGAQIVDVLLGEFQVVHGVDELLQTSHNGVAAAIGHAAEEHIKDGDLVHIPLIQVAGRHGQLVEICHGRKVAFYV